METSNNLAAVNPKEGAQEYEVVMSSRSSIGPALQAQRDIIAKAAKLCGARIAQDNAYPGMPRACRPITNSGHNA